MGEGAVLVMAGDVGGTNARFALYSVPEGTEVVSEVEMLQTHELIFTRNYKNNDFEQFADAVALFLQNAAQETGENVGKLASACFAVAGPVNNNVVQLTNRGWNIAALDLERLFNIGVVKLVNDFAANGYGLLTLQPSEYEVLQEGHVDHTAPIGLIGAGTGLGECFLTCKGGEYDAFPCEGGHVEFAPRSELECEMLQFLSKKFGSDGEWGRVSAERIVSGKGIVNVYQFLANKFPDQVIAARHDKIMNSAEGGRHVSEMAYDYPLAKQTMEVMMAAYGSETGNLGLKLLPYGSIFIAGGIAPHNVEYMRGADSVFMRAFREKGRVASVLNDVPIRLVRSEDLGLRGAHVVATRLLNPARKQAAATTTTTTTSSTSTPRSVKGASAPCCGWCDTLASGQATAALATVAMTSLTAAFAGAAFYHLLSRR